MTISLLLGLCAVFVLVPLRKRPEASVASMRPTTERARQPERLNRHRQGFASRQFPIAVDTAGITMHSNSDDRPAWAVPYGREFWHAISPSPASGYAELDLGEVVSRVGHAIVQTQPFEIPSSATRAYTATFDGKGFQMALYRPSGVSAGVSYADDPSEPPASTTVAFESEPSAQAKFRTISVQSDGHSLYLAGAQSVPWSVLGNTAQGLLSGEHGIVEHYEVGQDGIEVSWVLQQALPTKGIEIDAELAGLTYWGQDESGQHHYMDTEGVARVYVSQVFLADATGKRVEVPLRAFGNLLHISVTEEMLNGMSLPLAIDPTVGSEFGVGNPTGTGGQTEPAVAVAANRGTNSVYLVTWTDTRNSLSSDIYGTRVGTNGTVLDPGGITVCVTNDFQSHSAIGYNGTNFLVAWQDKRTGTNDIFATRIGIDGTVLDPLGIVITMAYLDQTVPTVAAANDQYLVAWQDGRSGGTTNDIYGTRVSSAGVVLDAVNLIINAERFAQKSPRASSIGTNYFVVYFTGQSDISYDIYGNRVTSSGVTLDGAGIPICTNATTEFFPDVATDGTNYLAVWQDQRNDTSWDIYGARISSAGTVLDANGIAINTTNNTQELPAVTSRGVDFLVTWSDGRTSNNAKDIFGTVVTSAGVVTDIGGFMISTNFNTQTRPACASDGARYLVVHQSNFEHTSTNRIRGNLVTP